MKITCDIGLSLDGFGAGPNQSLDDPLGQGMERVHRWMFDEADQHRAELDAIVDAGAFVMGRNMFGADRGPFDLGWKGWWGDEPPYHGPVFVVTHHERDPLPMAGGTTFHFVTDGLEAAVARARAAAGERNVSVTGGVSLINQCLRAGIIDELRLHVAPLVVGAGERLFDGVGDLTLEAVGTPTGSALVTHRTYRVVR